MANRFAVSDGDLELVTPAPAPPPPKFIERSRIWLDKDMNPTTKAEALYGEVVGTRDGQPERVYIDAGARSTLTASLTGGEMATVVDEQPVEDAVPEGEAPVADWTAIFAVEGVDTSDERRLAPDSITWRTLPLTLMGQSVTDDGHKGAQVCGRIDTLERVGSEIVATGTFSQDAFGQQVMEWIGDGTLRGISIDLAVDPDGWHIEPYEDDTETDPADADLIDLFGPPGVMVVTAGVIMGATVTPFPAFAEASIMLASGAYDGKRKRVLRIGSSIELAFPPAKPAGAAPSKPATPNPGASPASPPTAADGTTDAVTQAALIADITEVAQDYAGVKGTISVTVDGKSTEVQFPDKGTVDPDQAEDDATLAALTAAATAIAEVTRAFARRAARR